MKDDTGARLAAALEEAERTRENLINCPAEEKGARGDEYVDAQDARNDALHNARQERAGAEPPPLEPSQPPGEEPAAPKKTASGDPLLAPPGVVVDASGLERFGALAKFRSKENPEHVVEATPYAFDAGTAIATPDGEVATEQPTRVIRTETLGLVTEDVFHQTYERVTDAPEQAPVSEPPAPEGAADSPPAEAPAESPPAPAEPSDPPSA